MNRSKLLIVIGVIGIVLLATFGLKQSTTQYQAANVGYDIGYTAPNFTLKTLEGKTVKLSDYRGKAVYLELLDELVPSL